MSCSSCRCISRNTWDNRLLTRVAWAWFLRGPRNAKRRRRRKKRKRRSSSHLSQKTKRPILEEWALYFELQLFRCGSARWWNDPVHAQVFHKLPIVVKAVSKGENTRP